MHVRALMVRMLAVVISIGGLSVGWTAPAHAAPVDGVVVDAGTGDGIVGAYVEAYGDVDAFDTTTAAGGGYVLDLPPGSYDLYASADGYESGYAFVEVTESTTALPTIELQPLPEPVTVTGSVVDAGTGDGVVGAYVEAYGDGYDDATTTDGGAYTLDLPPGLYQLDASAEGYETGSAEVEITGSTTTIPAIELQPLLPGVHVSVYNETFGGPAANAKVSLQPQGGGAATVLTTDGGGEAVFAGLAAGQYTVEVVAGNGLLPSGDPQLVDHDGGFTYVELGALVDLSCEPAAPNAGLTNMGFENGLDGWTLGYRTESIEAVGADAFTAPWEGSAMARLGHSQPSSGEYQNPGPNIMCQDFEVTDPEETFSFNVFTYDYTGFDEFRFDVVVTDPATGETLAAYEQGAWGQGTALKTSGWRGVKLDLADHVGDTVRLTFRAGGTSDELYAFWAYLDSAATLPPTIETSAAEVETETGSVTTDPTTGQLTVSMPNGDPSDLTLTLPAECQDPEATPTAVSLILNGTVFPGTPLGGGLFEMTIPEASIQSGPLSVQIECDGETTLVSPIGQIVLYDPSGLVTDAVSGAPVQGAEVSLFKVPGWTPQGADGPYPEDSCQTNLSKEAGDPWDQPAPTDLGELVSAASPEISPNVNPFITNNAGYYGWDVAEGCWYVEVDADGYEPLTSPVVGVPTAVTDLDLELQPTALVNSAKPTITGTPKVGVALTADPGTWNVDGATFAYQWFRGGSAISGATAKSYTPVPADLGEALRVRVTASKAGYADGVAQSDATAPVAAGALSNTGLPTVSDTTPQVGQAVTASDGSWSQAGVSLAYQWFRGGSAISGATAKSYTPVPADLGEALRVRVTASKAGYADSAAQSAATSPVAKGAITAAKPRIKGKPKVGKKLKAVAGASTPAAVKVKYQWLRNGKAIKRATKATYKVTRKDRRKKISVRVVRTAPGYQKLTLVSRAKRVR